MPTLQQITLAHSRALSEIHQQRDMRLAEAHAVRDTQLRALPAAAKAYQKYDEELTSAREKLLISDAKAGTARHFALLSAIDRRSDRLEDAVSARRSADTRATDAKRSTDADADRKYDMAMAGLRDAPPGDRQKVAQLAERARRNERDEAARSQTIALAASQDNYRGEVDRALIAEFRDSREGERAYLEALGLGDAVARGAQSAADQNLADALSRIPEAREILRSWRQQLATIVAESKEAEAEAFARFRLDLDSLKA